MRDRILDGFSGNALLIQELKLSACSTFRYLAAMILNISTTQHEKWTTLHALTNVLALTLPLSNTESLNTIVYYDTDLLDPAKDQFIRLLKVFHRESSDPLKCKLATHLFTPELEFEALSYT